MSATIATPEAIENACNTLWQMHGRDPTYEDVISMLGGGSNKTLSAPLKAWLGRPRPARHALPRALLDHSAVYQHQVWALALEAAEAAQLQRAREADERVARANAVRDLAMQEADSSRSQAEEQALKIEQLQGQVAMLNVRLEGTPELQARLQQVQQDNQILREALNAALLRATHAEGWIAGINERRTSAKSKANGRIEVATAVKDSARAGVSVTQRQQK